MRAIGQVQRLSCDPHRTSYNNWPTVVLCACNSIAFLIRSNVWLQRPSHTSNATVLQEQSTARLPARSSTAAGQQHGRLSGSRKAAPVPVDDGDTAVVDPRSDTANGSVAQAQLPTPEGRHDSEASLAGSETGASASSGSTQGTPPAGWRPANASAKPPRSRRGGRPQAALEPVTEPAAVSPSARAGPPLVCDSAGSGDLRSLKGLLAQTPADSSAPPQAPSSSAAALPYPAATADAPPPELAHVLSLLSRLLSASAVLVDLHEPPISYIRYLREQSAGASGRAPLCT